ncbi:MAG: flagellar protein FlgN [Thiotrichales bacterium]|jgi:flagellar biosynthesis/type III secretory pathway chaperone|nr:flagellar protein FlgN [Thiotrichales bacterium]MBT3753003.1 flagellar protein FlgN [Thiotrichales bacterium]MBT3838129.1 flagellar protein FlgN [Thiotrichales bacterium]MBT4151911.1 flagellar protein FlgN [Thiotrichales bacterium]MBT4261979.1 flagellar protein FlgN [Thiotrichales bacterium]
MVEQLLPLLKQQQSNATTLLSILEKEKEILLNGEPELIAKLLEEKEAASRRMGAAHDQLLSIAEHLNQPRTDIGLVECIKGADKDGSLQREWDSLIETTATCQKINQANGATINLKKRYAENGLAILRGQIGTSKASLYSKKGVEESGAQGAHILHKA